MIAVEATYEKGAIRLARHPGVDHCSVIVIFKVEEGADKESPEWLDAESSRLATIWDNDEDAIYDNV